MNNSEVPTSNPQIVTLAFISCQVPAYPNVYTQCQECTNHWHIKVFNNVKVTHRIDGSSELAFYILYIANSFWNCTPAKITTTATLSHLMSFKNSFSFELLNSSDTEQNQDTEILLQLLTSRRCLCFFLQIVRQRTDNNKKTMWRDFWQVQLFQTVLVAPHLWISPVVDHQTKLLPRGPT